MTTVLLIEDEPSICDIVKNILEDANYQVIVANNGQLGIQLAQQAKPDLILCDILMPEPNGYKVLTALHQSPITATLPFIFLTAKAEPDDIRQGMNLGADDYIVKPFTRNQLLNAITTRLHKQTIITENWQQKLQELQHQFSTALPHELLTPLNNILGLSEILQVDYNIIDRHSLLEIAKDISVSAQRLQRTIQNLLLYTRLQWLKTHNLASISPGICIDHLDLFVQEIVDQVAKSYFREADLQFHLTGKTVRITEVDLQKLIEELVDNACKFSPTGTPILVETRSEAEWFIFQVTDHGRGMTAAQIAEVGAYLQFERQLYEQQGLGLGLAIAQQLAELNGGTLKIESRPGQQTRVQVTLPAT